MKKHWRDRGKSKNYNKDHNRRKKKLIIKRKKNQKVLQFPKNKRIRIRK